MKIMKSQTGFTLVEIIAVLIILGILAAVAIPRYIDLEENAEKKAIEAGIGELNGREALIWADVKISTSGYIDDGSVWGRMDVSLGPDYSWAGTGATEAGGNLIFRGTEMALTRSESTKEQPAVWRKPVQ